MVWVILALSMLFDYILMQNESWMCSLNWKKWFGVILEKGWIMEISIIDYERSFCPLVQINKIIDVFGVGLRKRTIKILMYMIMKWNWVLWHGMVMGRTKALLHDFNEWF